MKMTDKEFFKNHTTKPVLASGFKNVKSPNVYNINKKEFEIIKNDEKLYCDSCGHKSYFWAENDKYKDDDEHNQMLCPRCYSWNYFEGGYTWDIKITNWNNER